MKISWCGQVANLKVLGWTSCLCYCLVVYFCPWFRFIQVYKRTLRNYDGNITWEFQFTFFFLNCFVNRSYLINLCNVCCRNQSIGGGGGGAKLGWRSAKRTRLPPVWAGFDSKCCWFSSLLREVFLRVLRFSPLLKNQHFQIPIRSVLLSNTLS